MFKPIYKTVNNYGSLNYPSFPLEMLILKAHLLVFIQKILEIVVTLNEHVLEILFLLFQLDLIPGYICALMIILHIIFLFIKKIKTQEKKYRTCPTLHCR